MTPLAVMNSKLDTLLQDSELTEKQGALIGDVYNTVTKMKRLNKSMLLLSRIENRMMQEQNTLNLYEKITTVLNDFQELLTAKNLKIHALLQDTEIIMNKDLLDVLLNNLLGNAIRHNHTGGEIWVNLQQGLLTIANTGSNPALEPDEIFQRFHKSSDSEGAGLGLTLSRQICENYHFKLSYAYIEKKHTFTVYF